MHTSKRDILISYWAETELAFISIARRLSSERSRRFELIKVSHHPTWFSPQKSKFTNFAHLARQLQNIVRTGRGRSVCVFGTNLVRLTYLVSWLFSETHFVYNELPEYRKERLLFWLDALILKRAAHVYVSTEARAAYVKRQFGLKRKLGVIENISFETFESSPPGTKTRCCVFAGTITPKRFSPNDLEGFRAIRTFVGSPIDVYGQVLRGISDEFGPIASFKGSVSHAAMLQTLSEYQYAVLAYYRGEPNYELCAPLKLYEYIAAGCTVISVNRNRGLELLAKSYPNLIVFADDLDRMQIDKTSYANERKAFLQLAIESNGRFADILVG